MTLTSGASPAATLGPGLVRRLPGPETAILGRQAPCVPAQKRHTTLIYDGER